MEKQKCQKIPKYKLVFIGDSNVGKSCILNRFLEKEFKEEYQYTVGYVFQEKKVKINNQDIKLLLYDTAGKEKFRHLIPIYARDANIILLVYDICSKDSFIHLSKWLKSLSKINTDKIIFSVVGNKIDEEDKREVKKEEGENFATKNGFIFAEVSSKTGEGIYDFFYKKLFEKIKIKFLLKDNQRTQDNNNNIKSNLEIIASNNKDFSEINKSYENRIKELEDKLNKANKIIMQQRIEIQELKNRINFFEDNESNAITQLKTEITMKENELTQLKYQIQNSDSLNEKIALKDIKCILIKSVDQNILYSIPCTGHETFAEIEEELYKEYPEYRETNNTFLSNGTEILRFKTINDNKLESGKAIILIKPS